MNTMEKIEIYREVKFDEQNVLKTNYIYYTTIKVLEGRAT